MGNIQCADVSFRHVHNLLTLFLTICCTQAVFQQNMELEQVSRASLTASHLFCRPGLTLSREMDLGNNARNLLLSTKQCCCTTAACRRADHFGKTLLISSLQNIPVLS